MTRAESIGVVGAAGDLGAKLTGQMITHGIDVNCFDTAEDVYKGTAGKTWLNSADELAASSSLIHLCAPVSVAATVGELTPEHLLVLHDSVMAKSQDAAEKTKELPNFAGSIAVVHCLMNPEGGVVVDSESDELGRITDHLQLIGLKTHIMSADEHDTIMAESQAPFALLHDLLMPNLSSYAERGLLTPSGEALRKALEDRSARWTPETLRSILSNPNLPQLIADMDLLVDDIQRIDQR